MHPTWQRIGMLAAIVVGSVVFVKCSTDAASRNPNPARKASGTLADAAHREGAIAQTTARDAGAMQQRQLVGAFTLESTDRVPVPEEPIVDVAAKLRPAAEQGDERAALALYLALNRCRNSLREPVTEEMVRAFERMNAATSLLAEEAAALGDCREAREMVGERGRWLVRSADAGNLEARLIYASDAEAVLGQESAWLADPARVAEYKRKSERFLEEAAANGNIDSMLMLADGYTYGVMQAKDIPRALAYYRAADKARPGLVDPGMLRTIEQSLTAEEIARAQTLADSILAQCCASPSF